MKILEFISKLIDLIKSYFDYKNTKAEIEKEKQESNKTEDLEKQKQESNKTEDLEKQKQEISDAVQNNDVDKINQLINSCILIIISFSCLILTGCASTKVIYVPGDRQVKSLTYENVEGYFVPKQVMSELLQYKVEAKYYKDKYENQNQ